MKIGIHEVVVDDIDQHILRSHTWHIVLQGRRKQIPYAQTKIAGRNVYLHRLIAGTAVGVRCDHKNGNTLDCRRDNLRSATAHQNGMNKPGNPQSTSKFKGVSWRGPRHISKPWRARIAIHGKDTNIGDYGCQEDAARAYDAHATKLFGEFAKLNFPG